MKIVLVAPAIADYSVEYANALSRRAKVTLIAPAAWFVEPDFFADARVRLKPLDWPRHRSLRNPLFLMQVMRAIGSEKPDVVHFLSEGVTWLGLLARPISRRYALVTTMHDVQYHPGDSQSRRVPRWFADQLFRYSNRVVVHGDRLRDDAAKLYPGMAGKLEVLPHVMLERYSNVALKRSLRRTEGATVNVLFFGRIFAYKGLHILIRSIPLVLEQFRRLKVIVAGRGDDIDSYKRMVAEPDIFDFRSYHIGDTEVAQLFVDADIVVLPYVEASQSGVLAIANSFAKATVVTNVGELALSVVDGKTGLIVPPGDEQALAAAILKLATDEALRRQIGSAAREAAERAASPQVVADLAMRIYASIG
jgi:glycosyltransferase involved in cell wall biosynthesis